MQGKSGPVVLLLFGIGCFSVPLLASIISDDDLGVFLVTVLTLGPLAVLLYVGGGRDDGRRASSGFARRAPMLAVAACAFVGIAFVAAVLGNPAWLPCLWISVFLGVAAHAWGYRVNPKPAARRRQDLG